MANTNSSEKLRIAVSGGGLAGAAIANALINIPHLEVHVYESAPEFSERGAAVGLAINAQRALETIVPSATDLLVRAGAVSMNSTRLVVGSGPNAGTLVFDLAGTGVDPGLVVHRAALLRELLAPIQASSLHPGKKLVSIVEEQSNHGGLELHFQDGTIDTVDALIGADGIFSSVRQYLLGDAEPAEAAGWWDCRNVVPFEKAKEKLGAQYFEEPRQYSWVGDNGFIMHDILDDGKSVQCVCSAVELEASSERRRDLSRAFLDKTFGSWLEGPIGKPMIDLILDQEDSVGYSQWEHKHTSKYARGRVCIAGDAAHAMTPWQGSGASQALEDAAVLAAVLSKIKTPAQIEAAFKAYDSIRRPRAQAIVDSSRQTGRILTTLERDIGTDPQKLGAALAPRWGFIYDFDIGKHREKAVAAMEALL